MDVGSLWGGGENVCENNMQIYCSCFCVGLECEGNTLLPLRGILWLFFEHLFRFFPLLPSLPLTSWIVCVVLLRVSVFEGVVLGLVWCVLWWAYWCEI